MAEPREINTFQRLILTKHGFSSKYLRAECVLEEFDEKIRWDCLVWVFQLKNPERTICYAWSYREANEQKHIAILETPEINSAARAIRAARAGHRTEST